MLYIGRQNNLMKISFYIAILLVMVSCSSESLDRNPYLEEANFKFEINLNLASYSSLTTTGNAIYIGNTGVGTKGIFVINAGFNTYYAWEASCPNHSPNLCSKMTIIGGTNVKCSCENYEYSLFNGYLLSTPETEKKVYGLLNYRTSLNGSFITVSN